MFETIERLKVSQSIIFSLHTNVFHCFCFALNCSNSKQKAKQHKLKTSSQSYKTQIKIPAYPGLAYWGFEPPGPGAPLLSLAKSTAILSCFPILRYSIHILLPVNCIAQLSLVLAGLRCQYCVHHLLRENKLGIAHCNFKSLG